VRRACFGAVAALLLTAAAPAATPSPATLADVLATHLRALQSLKVPQPRTLETQGTLEGLGLHGSFHAWRDGDDERYDETLGIRTERTLRLHNVEYVQNSNGDVRLLHGIAARRQVTEDFIDSGEFARHPENDQLLGPGKLRDGRDVWRLLVEPPGGEPYGVALDRGTSTIDEEAYPNGDSVLTTDYSDFRIVDGSLVPFIVTQSSGDHEYDITAHVTSAYANHAIDRSIFAPFAAAVVDESAPVTVGLLFDRGHYFVRGSADGKPLLLLVDSGSQGLFLDPGAAKRLGLSPEGTVEIRGAKRTSGLGVATIDDIDIGGARLPAHVVSVVDLSPVTYNGVTADGVLGYPFFAAAEVRIDPDSMTMTIAKPGTLPVRGTPIPIDTDRELPEMAARLNGTVNGRFLIDTGNSNDLLLFHAFVQSHPGAVFYGTARNFAQNRGIGGSSAAVRVTVYQLKMGPFDLYNREADVILTDTGAFADSEDAGNIGLGSLRNFVFTFDFPNRTLYLEKAHSFDDGRYRPQIEDRSLPRPP
jgi:hypothetical protein